VLANGDDESDLVGLSLLLLAATVRSFAQMPLGISDRNTGMANVAAINTKQHGGANNEKIQLETLVRSVGAHVQAIVHIISCLHIKKD